MKKKQRSEIEKTKRNWMQLQNRKIIKKKIYESEGDEKIETKEKTYVSSTNEAMPDK